MNNKITDFFPLRLTSAGRALVNQANDGKVISFTRAALGDGTVKNEEIEGLDKIKSEKLSIPIAKVTMIKAGQTRLQFRINNSKVEETFAFSELGIMAKVDGGKEVLYAYAKAKPDGVHKIYDKTYPVQERIINVDMIISNTDNIKALLDLSIIYATLQDIADHNNDKDAHPLIQAELKRLDDTKADKKAFEEMQKSAQEDGMAIMQYLQEAKEALEYEKASLKEQINRVADKQKNDAQDMKEKLNKAVDDIKENGFSILVATYTE